MPSAPPPPPQNPPRRRAAPKPPDRPPGGSRHPELHRRFARPDPAFSPVPLWWWSGAYEEGVTAGRLHRQLERLAEQGVRNAVVMNLAPTGPLYGKLADRPAFLSEPWWRLLDAACASAAELGVRLWFYDQIGFSGANLQGDLVADDAGRAGHTLARASAEASGRRLRGGPLPVRCPAEGAELAVTAVPLDAEGSAAGPPVPRQEWPGRLADGARYRVSLVYVLREGFDYFAPDACAALLDTVHGEVERRLGRWFGRVVAGSFQDELPALPSWGARFAEAFRGRWGYDPVPLLAALWEDWGPEAERLRGAYHGLRAALAEEAFFRPLHAWHARHGLLVGCDQQSPARSGEPGGGAQLYGDYPRTHRWFGAPGTDHHGSAKLHSSLAHHYGRPRSWIEAFHSSGWGGTPEETFDWLLPWLAAGATLYDPHAVYYSSRSGWFEWAPPSTCWRQPYWRHYRIFADAVARLCGVLSEGSHACRVAVLYPGAAGRAGTLLAGGATAVARRAHAAYFALVGDEEWYHAVPGALGRLGVDFDVLDDDTAAGARVAGGGVAGPGEPGPADAGQADAEQADAGQADVELVTEHEAYRTVLVPSCAVLEGATALRLLQFARSGGRLVFLGDLPERAAAGPGGRFAEAGGAAVEALRALAGTGAVPWVPYRADAPDAAARLDEALGAVLDGRDRWARAPVPTLSRRAGGRRIVLVTAAEAGSATAQPIVPGPVRADGAQWTHLEIHARGVLGRGYSFDPARYRERVRVRLAGALSDVEQWDPVTGAAVPVPVRRAEGWTEAEVSFAAAPAVVLVGREAGAGVPDPATAAPPTAGPAARRADGTGGGDTADCGPDTPRQHSGGSGGRGPDGDTRPGAVPSAAFRGADPSPRGPDTAAAADPARSAPAAADAGVFPAPAAPGPHGPVRAVPLDGPWRSRIVPTTDLAADDAAPPAVPSSGADAVVEQWRMPHTTGGGDAPRPPWRTVLVDVGTRAWWFGPADPADLPDPLTGADLSGPGLSGRLRGGVGKAVRYSPARGIEKDPLHRATLGPSGTVPEEFWHAGGVRAGQAVLLRTTLPGVPDDGGAPLHLAVGAGGRKDVWWNGRPLPADPGGYLRIDPVAADAVRNVLEVRVTAERDGALRGHWCLTRDAGAFRRPEWVTPATPARRGSAVRIATTLELDAAPEAATVQFGTIGPCALRVNGTEVGRQGAFDPYPERPHHRVVPYDVAARLRPGRNTVEAVFTDPGTFPVALLVDGVLRLPDGRATALVSDASWTVRRDGAPERAALRRAQHGDPRFSHLVPRPHPLPRTRWLEPRPAGGVLDLLPDAFPGDAPRTHWYRLDVPPGAYRVELPEPIGRLPGVRAWLAGPGLGPGQAPGGEGWTVLDAGGPALELPRPDVPGRVLLLAAAAPGDRGHGGALWSGPARFRCGAGAVPAGPWAGQGLASFAGGVRYTRTVDVPDGRAAADAVLDLGRVRGTAEVAVNGRPAGVRVLSPYRFPLGGLLRPGGNELSVTVFGTLAPYLDDASPTPYVLPGQRDAGLLGPVRLLFGGGG